MNINELTQKALRIKNLYAEFDTKEHHKKWTTEEVYEGLVSDVGDLGRLVLAKEGFRELDDIDKNLQHELAEILCAVLLIGDSYKIDVTQAFLNEMDRLESSLSK